MKNRIIKVSLLIVITIATLWITVFVLASGMKNCKEDTVGKINGVVAHDLDFKMTIWGASTAQFNFNPQIIIDSLHISTMNMGIDGTNIDQYAGLLNEFISYTEESEYLVIALDIHGGLANRNSYYHLHNWVHNIDNDNIYNCLSDIDKQTMFKLKYVPFYSLIKYDKHAFPYFRKSIFNKRKDYAISNYGFKSKGNTIIETGGKRTNFEIEIDERSFNKVKYAVEKASEQGIKCMVIITPCFVEGLSQISNRADFITKIETLKTAKVKVVNLSNCYISKEPKYFKDNTHLNAKGADELTKLFVKKIKEYDHNGWSY